MALSNLSIAAIALSPFLLHGALSVLSTLKWAFTVMRCSPGIKQCTNKKFTNWAIVTGCTSGIGLGFATELARKGFNLLLVARSTSKAMTLSDDLQKLDANIKIKCVIRDLEDFPSTGHTVHEFVEEIKQKLDGGVLSLLVCNAGMSDLCRHFTDKPLERNLKLNKLNTFANLAIIQSLMPLLVSSKTVTKKCAGVITTGALTSLYPAPIFAVSSGNKHFLRGFTLAAREEFRGSVNFMIAHPVAVHSGILSKEAIYGISAQTFVRNVLNDYAKGRSESFGHLFHEVPTKFMIHFMNDWVRGKLFLLSISHFQDVLNRKVNLEKIEDKIGENVSV